MKKKLQSIAMQLSESEIQELVRLKKMGDKKLVSLNKKRDKIVAQLEAVDAEIAAALGAEAPVRKRRAGRKPAAVKAPAKKKKRGGRVNLSVAVREIFSQAGTPLKAKDVVDALPDAGIKVRDVAAMRKRISVVLASQKNHFEQVERGVYQLKG